MSAAYFKKSSSSNSWRIRLILSITCLKAASSGVAEPLEPLELQRSFRAKTLSIIFGAARRGFHSLLDRACDCVFWREKGEDGLEQKAVKRNHTR